MTFTASVAASTTPTGLPSPSSTEGALPEPLRSIPKATPPSPLVRCALGKPHHHGVLVPPSTPNFAASSSCDLYGPKPSSPSSATSRSEPRLRAQTLCTGEAVLALPSLRHPAVGGDRSSSLSLTCAGLPANTTCTFTPDHSGGKWRLRAPSRFKPPPPHTSDQSTPATY